ncbi:MAG: flagellar hook-associated protein FlgK [Chthonomonas sp.]|nr:flagellar hook-associated protein FlgK [Chthonomonas sp.]
MPSPFHGIELASRALRAFQRSLDVTGHNIANANTRGYTRQVVDLATTDPVTYWQNGARSLGTGVQVGSINRVRDLFLEGRLQAGLSSSNQFSTIAQGIEGVLGVMHEPGSDGIGAALDKFFDSWSALSSNPSESANRMAVQQSGKLLASRIRGTYEQLTGYSANNTSEMQALVNQVNNIAESIASLNTQIREQVATGGTPNDLADRRDQAIRDLSELVNISTVPLNDGTVNVVVSQFTLVDNTGANALPANVDSVNGTLTGWTVPITIRGGKLAGLMQTAQTINREIGSLDQLANTLRTQVNAIHTSGINSYGNTNVQFFNDVASGPQTGAIDFNLSLAVESDYQEIVAGAGTVVSGTPTYVAGDTGLARSLSALRDLSIAALGNRSIKTFHKDSISRLGSESNYYDNAAGTQDALISQITEQQQSVSGVNLDEEMSNMLRFQRSYQAAAKVLTIFDQVTEDLLGMLRR